MSIKVFNLDGKRDSLAGESYVEKEFLSKRELNHFGAKPLITGATAFHTRAFDSTTSFLVAGDSCFERHGDTQILPSDTLNTANVRELVHFMLVSGRDCGGSELYNSWHRYLLMTD